jgi:hypothetical protein
MCPETQLEKCGKFEKYIDRLLKMGDLGPRRLMGKKEIKRKEVESI